MMSLHSSGLSMLVFPEPASDDTAAELVSRLSIFVFSQLSATDQREKMEQLLSEVEEDETVNQQLHDEREEDFRLKTFTELLKKLPIAEQSLFLFNTVEKFKRDKQLGELISWFKQLDTTDQQRLIDDIVPVTPENLRIHEERLEDFILRRFKQLSRDYTSYVNKHVIAIKEGIQKRNGAMPTSCDEVLGENINEACDWELRFNEFFVGFMIIWFKAQSDAFQKQLSEKLCQEVREVRTTKRLRDENEEDFELRRFTKLCNVIEFSTRVIFLKKAVGALLAKQRLPVGLRREIGEREQHLRHGILELFPCRSKQILHRQNQENAVELLLLYLTFGFSLLSAKDQDIICGKKYFIGGVITERLAKEDEKDLRMKILTDIFNSLGRLALEELFEELISKFVSELRLYESILLFRQLPSDDQHELIEKLLRRLEPDEVKHAIIEKYSEESEEVFRVRRFAKLYCAKNPSVWESNLRWPKVKSLKRKRLGALETVDDEEIDEIKQSRYAQFFLGVSVIWFKDRWANEQRNPFQVVLGTAEEDGTIEKLADETEEDFRLRKFTETFKHLDFSSQECFIRYIQETEYRSEFLWLSPCSSAGGYSPPKHEFIKVKNPNLRGGTATTEGGQGTIQQIGGQGTSQP